MFALCLLIEKIAYSYPKVTPSDHTHLPLPSPSPPDHCLVISEVKLNVRVVVVVCGGGGWQPTLV